MIRGIYVLKCIWCGRVKSPYSYAWYKMNENKKKTLEQNGVFFKDVICHYCRSEKLDEE
jgi:hypothetical protein